MKQSESEVYSGELKFTGERFIPGIANDELTTEHMQRYRAVLPLAAGKCVIDAACGEGYGSAILSEVADSVIGIDISGETVQHARTKYMAANLQFIESNITNMPFEDAKADVLVSFETLEHVSEGEQRAFIDEAARVLKPNGMLIISTPNKEDYSDKHNYHNEFHIHELYHQAFIELISRKFCNIRLFRQYKETAMILQSVNTQAFSYAMLHTQLNESDLGKYMIAIASNSLLDTLPEIADVVLPAEMDFEPRLDRIILLQNEVEERNKHLGILDQCITTLSNHVSLKAQALTEKEQALLEKDQALLEKDHALMEKEQALVEKNQALAEKDQVLTEKDRALLEKDQTLLEKGQALLVKDQSILEKEQALLVKDQSVLEKDQALLKKDHVLVKMEQALTEKDKMLTEKEQALTEKDQVLAEKEQVLLGKDGALLEKDHALVKMEQALTEKNKMLAEKGQALTEKDQVLAEKEQVLLEKDLELAKMEQVLTEKNQALAEKDNMLAEKEQTLTEKDHILAEKDRMIAEKDQTILNKLGHIDLLLESDRELAYIKATRSYRLTTRLRNILWPHGSRRRFALRLAKKVLCHPLWVLQNINARNIKEVFRRLRTGNLAPAANLAENIVTAAEPSDNSLSIIYAANIRYDSFSISQFESPVVSIVVPVYNEWAYTYVCLRAVAQNSGDISYEVIVADDASTDETKELERYIKGTVHIRNDENLCFLKNCNHAAQYARGEYIVFLNNDTQVQPGWLEPLVRLIKNDPSVGLVGSKLVYPDGRLQEAGGIIWNDASGWNYGHFDDPSKPDYNYVKDADYISGAAIMVRKSLWNKLGGFDERFAPAYYEDTDLAFSIRKLGYRTVYQPQSVVVHFEGVSNGTDVTSNQKKYQITNQAVFLKKWKSELRGEHFPNGENVFWARDRSMSKKTILFIDHYVPMYDKDAGSRNIFMYVKLCVEMGYHVLFLGDNFYPHQPYTEVMQQMGIQVLCGAWYRDNWKQWLQQNGGYLDVAYLHRPHISEKYIDLVRLCTKAKIVYHGADLHCARIRAQYETEGNPELLEEAEKWERCERSLFAKSDLILTVSEKEKRIIESMSENKPVLVAPIFYFDKYLDAPAFHDRHNLLFVGGFAHVPNVNGILWFCKKVLPLLPPDTRVTIAGSNPPENILKLASDRITVTGYVSDEALTELYRASRIAIVPLRFGAGVKGKTVEAIYNLIPVVSTSFGLEGLPEVESIIMAHDDSESFAREIRKFLSSDLACEEAASQYLRWITQWFSKEHVTAIVKEITRCE